MLPGRSAALLHGNHDFCRLIETIRGLASRGCGFQALEADIRNSSGLYAGSAHAVEATRFHSMGVKRSK